MQLVALSQPVQDLQAPRNLFFDDNNAPALTTEDRLRIMELDARFNLAVDTRNFDLLEHMFTEDGIMDHQWGYRRGARQIADLIKSHGPAEKNVRHQNTNHVLKRHADGRVTMYSYLMAVRVGEHEHLGGPVPGGARPQHPPPAEATGRVEDREARAGTDLGES